MLQHTPSTPSKYHTQCIVTRSRARFVALATILMGFEMLEMADFGGQSRTLNSTFWCMFATAASSVVAVVDSTAVEVGFNSSRTVQTMSKELSAVQERIFISQPTFVDSPALPSEGHRKRFLSVRHHLCSHRFFEHEARSLSGAHVFPYFWRGQEMELVVLAATSAVMISSDNSNSDDGTVTLLFEALIYSSMRNQSQSNPALYSHCTSEASQFTSLSCVVNGKASPATIHDNQPSPDPKLQSVLKCSITASASKNFVVTLLSPDDSLQATLDLCALNRTTVHKVVGCTQPWMDADHLERCYPGYHRAYLL